MADMAKDLDARLKDLVTKLSAEGDIICYSDVDGYWILSATPSAMRDLVDGCFQIEVISGKARVYSM